MKNRFEKKIQLNLDNRFIYHITYNEDLNSFYAFTKWLDYGTVAVWKAPSFLELNKFDVKWQQGFVKLSNCLWKPISYYTIYLIVNLPSPVC